MVKTVEYYNAHARDFCSSTVNADMSYCRDKFTAYLPEGAHILDAGCGSGRDSRAFMEQGYIVTAMDASPAICEQAKQLLHQPVLCLCFDEFASVKHFLTSPGKIFFTLPGKEFFTSLGKQIFTLYVKHFFT